MPLVRRAKLLLLVAVLCSTARAGVVSGPVYAPPAGAWAGPLGVAFNDPSISPLLPPSLTALPLTSPDALRMTAPLVQSLSKALSISPQAFAKMTPADRKSALELAAEDAKDSVRVKAYELADTARQLSKPGRAMDKESRAELYHAVAKLMEMRQYYGPWLDKDADAEVQKAYELSSTRAWEVREFLLNRDAPEVEATRERPAVSAAPVAPIYELKPAGTAVALREAMKNNKSGWGQSDLDTLYTGYGFVLRQGGKHRFYSHPSFPQLTATVSRQNDLAPGYAQTALKDIAELERLVAAQRAAEAAPVTGPPATLTLADLSVLLSQPKPKPEKTRPVVQEKPRPVPAPVPARVAAKTNPAVPVAPAPPPVVPQLQPSTPKVVEAKPEPPPVKTSPQKPASLIDRIRLAFTRNKGPN